MRDIELDVKGQMLKIKEDGSGPPLLFLHGAGGSNWSPMLKALAETHRVIAPEHPGFGRSKTPDWMLSVGDLAYFYLDMLEVMDLRDIHLAGHSLGGWTVAELAIRNTSRLKSVTLLAPAGCRSDAVPFGDIFLWDAETATRNQFFDQKLAEERIKLLPQAELVVSGLGALTLTALDRLCAGAGLDARLLARRDRSELRYQSTRPERDDLTLELWVEMINELQESSDAT